MPSLPPFIDEIISAQTRLKKTAQALNEVISCLFGHNHHILVPS